MNPRRWSFIEWLALILFIAVVALIVAAVSGCTVTPDQVHGTKGAYAGNDANSGVVGMVAGGVEVTASAEARYEALVGHYGKGLPEHPFLPVLSLPVLTRKNDGKKGVTLLPNGHYALDREHFADFALMAEWARSGRTP